jgi:hypothetical protein
MWKWYNVEIDGGAYVDLNECVRDYSEDIIKLFTDEELKEEIQKRENGRSKKEVRINKLDTFLSNLQVEVDGNDVLIEIDNDDLMEEVRSRGLDEVEIIEPEKEELRKIICQTLDINEMYDDEEICDMLKEIWNISKYKNGMK